MDTERAGQFLTQCDGARYGNFIWSDPQGSYEVDGETGVSEFFFHRERLAADNAVTIRCKKWRNPTNCPVRGKISEKGEIQKLSGVHNHRPEYNGQGITVLRSRGNWIRSLRSNPRQSITAAVVEERKKMPMEAASQIVPVRHIRSAQRHSALARGPKVPDVQESATVDKMQKSKDFKKDIPEKRRFPGVLRVNEIFSSVSPKTTRARKAVSKRRAKPRIINRGHFKRNANLQNHDEQIEVALDELEQGMITTREFIDIVKYKNDEVAVSSEVIEEAEAFFGKRPTEWTRWVTQQGLQHDHEYGLPFTNHRFGDHSYGLPA